MAKKTQEVVDLFATAGKAAPRANVKSEKEQIFLSSIKNDDGSLKYPQAAQLLLDFQKAHKAQKEAEAVIATKGAEIKEIGQTIWIEKFQELGSRPESFTMVGDDTPEAGKLMFISSDAYKDIDEITATILEQKYGCIDRNPIYTIPKEMVQKYAKVLSKMILESDEIEAADKLNIIKKDEKPRIAKGTIGNVALIQSITGKPAKGEYKFADVAEMIANVSPTFSLKNC